MLSLGLACLLWCLVPSCAAVVSTNAERVVLLRYARACRAARLLRQGNESEEPSTGGRSAG